MLGLSSCRSTALKLAGMKQPEVETLESIKDFCTSINVDFNEIFVIKTTDMLSSLSKNTNADIIFDKNGYALDYNQSFDRKSCKGNVILTIKSIPPISYINRDSSIVFEGLKKTWMPLNDTLSDIKTKSSDSDYTVVVYWNKFSGNARNKDRIANIKQSIKENDLSKIQLVLINQDIRQINGVEFGF